MHTVLQTRLMTFNGTFDKDRTYHASRGKWERCITSSLGKPQFSVGRPAG